MSEIVNLRKGQRVDVGLSKISVGLGWNPNTGSGYDFDLDASAFMLNAKKLLPSAKYFVFFNNEDSLDGAVHHTGDDPTGGNSDEGDDEVIQVDLSKVNAAVEEILFVVSIHDYEDRKQNFGQVRNAYIRIVDDTTNKEIAKYELDEDFSIESAVEFGRLYRKSGKWKFEAAGIGYKEDLGYFVQKYSQGIGFQK
jgi:tellurium resistance protein TerD